MKDRVIYTSITGGYDTLPQPAQIYDGYDYICFTDDISTGMQGVWQLRKIPFECEDKIRLSRFVKICPHKALPEYRYSVYIDSNIQILDDFLYKCVEAKIKEGVTISLSRHPEDRKDIYEEAVYVMKYRRALFKDVKEQILFLRREGYPENTGMYENNLIFRQHNDPTVIRIDDAWWDLFVRFTKRDQLSFVYVLWKMDVWPPYLLPNEGLINVRTKYSGEGNDHLRRISHHRNNKNGNQSIWAKGWNFFWYMTYGQIRILFYRLYFQKYTRVYGLRAKV